MPDALLCDDCEETLTALVLRRAVARNAGVEIRESYFREDGSFDVVLMLSSRWQVLHRPVSDNPCCARCGEELSKDEE